MGSATSKPAATHTRRRNVNNIDERWINVERDVKDVSLDAKNHAGQNGNQHETNVTPMRPENEHNKHKDQLLTPKPPERPGAEPPKNHHPSDPEYNRL